MAFTDANLKPDLKGRDNNFTTELYFAKKAANLDFDSASGWQRAGALETGSYQVTNTTGTNQTRLGSTNTKRRNHINQQDFQLTGNFLEITPFGLAIKNKTTMNIDPVSVVYATTQQWTVAAAGGGLKTITLDSGTDIEQFYGRALEIPLSTGDSLYYERAVRLESLSTDTITLEESLDEVPADGVTIKVVDYVEFEPGGAQFAKWSGMAVISGDEEDKLMHLYPELEVVDGNMEMPNQNSGMLSFTGDITADTVTRNGRKQPRFMRERLYLEKFGS